MDNTAFWGAVGLFLTSFFGLMAARRTARTDDRSAAFAELMKVVDTLRAEVRDLRAELEHERERARLADERAVSTRKELHSLRNWMMARGIVPNCTPAIEVPETQGPAPQTRRPAA